MSLPSFPHRHKVFVSYHHSPNDQNYKEELIAQNDVANVFVDKSIDTGDIDPNLPDQKIREIIRDERLRDSTVTILLAGSQTWKRMHVDWEIYSSMIDGPANKKSGILVITLPSINTGERCISGHGKDEKIVMRPDLIASSWVSIGDAQAINNNHGPLPTRILYNLEKGDAKISLVPWARITDQPEILWWLIEFAHRDKADADYGYFQEIPMMKGNLN
ncbi:MAG: TIR domain-containing protein [Pseudomonadota bacterium]